MMLDCIEELGDGFFFVCAGTAMRQLRIQADLLAKTKVPVLIVGEGGSGKETAARLIHKLSGQSPHPIVVIDCFKPFGRLDRELFRLAHGPSLAETGSIRPALSTEYQTVVFKNIVRLPPQTQTQILNYVMNTASRRTADGAAAKRQFRILATCSQSIEMSVGDGSFSRELYAYLSAFTIYIPPLRHRQDEIPFLVSHLMNQIAWKYGLPPRLLSGAAQFACQAHSWPGNLKELEDFVKRYLVMGEAAPLAAEVVTEVPSQKSTRPK